MRKLFLLLPSIFMSSCFLNPYSGNFSCPGYRPGICASIPDVYRMYKQGAFSDRVGGSVPAKTYAPKSCKTVKVCRPNVCSNKPSCVEKKVCKPDSVCNHIDYRAQAVKDNTNE